MEEQNMVEIEIDIDDELLEKINKYINKAGISMDEFFRLALNVYFDNIKKEI